MRHDSPTEPTRQSGVNSTKWMEFVVLGAPVPENTKRPYVTERVKNYRKRVAEAAAELMYGQPCLTGPIRVHHGFHMPIPKNWGAKKRADAIARLIWPDVKPDYENLIKPVNDACKGIVWDDDARVCRGSQFKVYSEQPRTVVLVKKLGEGS